MYQPNLSDLPTGNQKKQPAGRTAGLGRFMGQNPRDTKTLTLKSSSTTGLKRASFLSSERNAGRQKIQQEFFIGGLIMDLMVDQKLNHRIPLL